MSETATASPATDEPLFDRAELQQFGADDTEAGTAICKMLSWFFFYTVIVMGITTYVTYRWVTAG